MSSHEEKPEYTDDFDEYDINQEKFIHSSHSGKGRTKKEACLHTNHADPGGHTRKAVTKLINNSHNTQKPHTPTGEGQASKKVNDGI
uniref:Nuclear protein 1 n=1 Tax=Octopus bimaculoides TaxID=37653 RepID=A0A0L8GBR5_OCTBM